MHSEAAFSAEDEAFFQGGAADAADSVRPVTLDGHAALEEEDEATAPSDAPVPGRFERPVKRVVAALALLAAAALTREALRGPAEELAAAPAAPLANAAPALAVEVLADDLVCSPAHVDFTTEESDTSSMSTAGSDFIGPPAPPPLAEPAAPAPARHEKARVKPHTKVAATTRTVPTKPTARAKSVSTAALLHAVRAQHAKGPSRR